MRTHALIQQPELTAPINLEELGLSIREMAIDVVDTDATTVLSRWYHSPKDVDLFIWSDDQNVVLKHQLSFLGQVIEWSVFDGFRTGVMIETETGKGEADIAEVIRFDQALSGQAIVQGAQLLRQIPALFEKEQILRHYFAGAEFPRQLREQLLVKYDFALQEKFQAPTFWRRFRKWFFGAD